MASSTWLFGSPKDFDTYYSQEQNKKLTHPIKKMYTYKCGSVKRLIFVHDSDPKHPLKSVAGYTLQHLFHDDEFKELYGNNPYVEELQPTDITINLHDKLLIIKPHRWLFFLKPHMEIPLDKLWFSGSITRDRIVHYPMYDHQCNRLCYILPQSSIQDS